MTDSDEPKLEVAIARRDDASEIGRLWSVCQPDSVWSQLGGDLLTIYFRRYCAGRDELAVTARIDGRLVGACVGTGRSSGHARRFYLKYALALGAALARQAAARPSVVAVCARRTAYGLVERARAWRRSEDRGRTPAPVVALEADRDCYMANFFVAPSARGARLGSIMLMRFCDVMAARGFDRCVAHTTIDNAASQTAQRRAGFECIARHDGDLTFARTLTR